MTFFDLIWTRAKKPASSPQRLLAVSHDEGRLWLDNLQQQSETSCCYVTFIATQRYNPSIAMTLVLNCTFQTTFIIFLQQNLNAFSFNIIYLLQIKHSN